MVDGSADENVAAEQYIRKGERQNNVRGKSFGEMAKKVEL